MRVHGQFPPSKPLHPGPAQHAFTLLELVVCLGVVLFLSTLLVPTNAAARLKSRNSQCLANMKQLMNALLLYSQDYRDYLPPNPNDGNTVTGHNWCQGMAGIGGAAEFNPDILRNPQKAMLATYLQNDPTPYRCAADQRTGRYSGTDPALVGKVVPAARTVAMNQAVGTMCASFEMGAGHTTRPTNSVNGPWLNNMASHRRNMPFRTYGKVSEMVVPSPAALWVLVEENPISINDAGFAFGMVTSEWIDYAGYSHNAGCAFAFADGHAELHRWRDPRTLVQVATGRISAPNSADWAWMAAHTSARAQ